MIKDNQTRFNRLHVLLDALVIAAAYILSWFIFLKIGMFGKAGILPTWFYMSALVIIVPVYLLLYTFFKLFTPKRVQGRRLEFANIFKANLIGLFLLGQFCIWEGRIPTCIIFQQGWWAVFLINIAAETLERYLIRNMLPLYSLKDSPRSMFFWLVTAGLRKDILTVCYPIQSGDIESRGNSG